LIHKIVSFLSSLPIIIFYVIIALIIYLYLKDKFQKQHSILKTHPILGRLRYIFEKIGPEFRQYWFEGNKEGRPVDRDTMETIAKAGKYASTVIGFGSKKDFSRSDFYLANSMFPKNVSELRVNNTNMIKTYLYKILSEGLVSRNEKRLPSEIKPWHLLDEDAIVIGPNLPKPFVVKGFIGVSAMSYGALSKSAVKALAQGVAISQGSWMNTGEGGLSPYHLSKIYESGEIECHDPVYLNLYHYIQKHEIVSNFDVYEHFHHTAKDTLDNRLLKMVEQGYISCKSADLIFQVGSGLFGAREHGEYSELAFAENATRPEVKAIEIKLAQGAKVRGGKLPKEKITPEIAEIRGVEMGRDVESPNRFPLFENMDELFDLIKRWRELSGGKPVGIKVVAGNEDSFVELALKMKETGEGPDFITIDGSEGGTGATYQEMADSLGLPIYSGLVILHDTLVKYGVRDRVKIFASGMLATADKMAIALSLGADFVNTARAAMHTVGCVSAGVCNTGFCPTGVTTHNPNLERGLVVEEKRFRTANYLATMRQGVFMLGASCGLNNPTKFERKHVTYRDSNNSTRGMDK
jgi:glutamate synthase domain-containing protein 2